MGKGEWRAMDKSSLLPFRDVFPGKAERPFVGIGIGVGVGVGIYFFYSF